MYSSYRVQGLYLDSEVATEGLRKMLRDNKHFQNLDKVQYLLARIYAKNGDPIAAQRLFRSILYPEPGKRPTTIRGDVHFRMGELVPRLSRRFPHGCRPF